LCTLSGLISSQTKFALQKNQVAKQGSTSHIDMSITSMDDQIREARLELQSIRHAQSEARQEFYKKREELRCGIDLLRLRIEDVLDVGLDFNVYLTAMQEANQADDFPYVALHFGHQALLLSTIHQMEMRNSLLKLTGTQSKGLVEFVDQAKNKLEEENAVLAAELSKNTALYVVDDRLAQTIVAQRLVIRKLNSLIERECSTVDEPAVALGTFVRIPLINEALYDVALDFSCVTFDSVEESPRDIKNLVTLREEDDEIMEMGHIYGINATLKRQWGMFQRQPA
jgi:hypothetical protein